MANNGLGIRVLVMSIGVVDTLTHQVAEPAIAEHMSIAPRQIATQRIDGNLQNQPWWLFGCRGKRPKRKYCRSGYQSNPQTMHRLPNSFHGCWLSPDWQNTTPLLPGIRVHAS
jgi:hypothetical protein